MINTPDLAMMKRHVETLFRCDSHGRLLDVREPGTSYASPRFFMGRTRQGNVWHFRHDLPQEVIAALDELCCAEPTAVGLGGPPQHRAAIRSALHAHAPITAEERGPAYWIPRTAHGFTDVVRITRANAELLHNAGFLIKFEQVSREVDVGPITAVVVQGRIASICYCARLSTVAAEAGVQTSEPMRGRGYATSAVAGWAAAVREQGLVPLYSTSWDNAASQAVARKLEMIWYGEDWSIE